MKSMKGTRLIIDTDLGFDCDDAGALALANLFQNGSILQIVSVTHSVNKQIGGRAVKAINEYYGNPNIPIGIAERYAIDVDCFFDEFYAKFEPADNFSGWKEKPSFYKLLKALKIEQYNQDVVFSTAREVIVKALMESPTHGTTFLCIGQANNLADMMDGTRIPGQNFSYRELLLEKTDKIVMMCGNFSNYGEKYLCGDLYWKGEFNVLLDIKSAQKVFTLSEVPIYVLDFNQGSEVLTGKGLKGQEKNPVYQMYRAFRGDSLASSSWDVLALLYASGKYTELFDCSKCGKVQIDNNGKSTFQVGGGSHYLIALNRPSHVYEEVIDHFYEQYR